MKIIRIFSPIFISVLVISALCSPYLSDTVHALNGNDFQPGRIIDDEVLTNKSTMSVQQIQDFLNSQVPSCDYNHPTYIGGSGTTYYPPYTCLKDFQENPTTGSTNYGQYNSNGTPVSISGGQTAAQIIWNAAQTNGINPQVLIVLLQKEQGLVTDTWPILPEYTAAAGYECPDSGSCSSTYAGFYNQVTGAAWQMRHDYNGIGTSGYWSPFIVGQNNIPYSTNSSCGTESVNIVNQATAVLYKYTPYVPNSAALGNLYGLGNSCSSYGNLNFWLYFNDWFGSTFANCIFPENNDTEVYRLTKDGTENSFLTEDPYEVCLASANNDYLFDGIVFNDNLPAGSNVVPVYRLRLKDTYLYSIDQNEVSNAVKLGYTLEGQAFNASNSYSITSPYGMYRLVNINNGSYFYSTSKSEINLLTNEYGYSVEGVAFYVNDSDSTLESPVYRLSSPISGYLFTSSQDEINVATSLDGFSLEGQAFNAIQGLSPTNLPVYRLAGESGYLYTVDPKERSNAINLGFRYEGIAFYEYYPNTQSMQPVYRLVNNGNYLYTISSTEMNNAIQKYNYNYEGIGFSTP